MGEWTERAGRRLPRPCSDRFAAARFGCRRGDGIRLLRPRREPPEFLINSRTMLKEPPGAARRSDEEQRQLPPCRSFLNRSGPRAWLARQSCWTCREASAEPTSGPLPPRQGWTASPTRATGGDPAGRRQQGQLCTRAGQSLRASPPPYGQKKRRLLGSCCRRRTASRRSRSHERLLRDKPDELVHGKR